MRARGGGGGRGGGAGAGGGWGGGGGGGAEVRRREPRCERRGQKVRAQVGERAMRDAGDGGTIRIVSGT